MIYDCFTFFNELDLLEIRLNELTDVVDRFVLVESPRTFSNQPKPLHYQENRHRFAPWNARIIHVVIDDTPPGVSAWSREYHQRHGIGRGLVDCHPNDVILVSDLDEIPRASRVREYQDTPGVKLFQHRLSYYFLNNVCDEPIVGTRMLSSDDFCRLGGAQGVRAASGTVIADGGWHFSYMGGVASIRSKLQAYSHQEHNTAQYTDPHYIGDALRRNVDLFGRGMNWQVSSEPDLPQYVLDHKERFRDWLCEAPPGQEEGADDPSLEPLAEAYQRVKPLPGDVVTLGGAKGPRIVALANLCYPEPLLALDAEPAGTEAGSRSGMPGSGPGEAGRELRRQIRMLTLGNVALIAASGDPFLNEHRRPIKFCYIEAAHDPHRIRESLQSVRARLVPGGVLCGSGLGEPASGLRAVLDELLPGFVPTGSFWCWQEVRS